MSSYRNLAPTHGIKMRESVTLYANFHMFRLTEKNYIYCNLIEVQRKRRNKRNNHRNEEDVSLTCGEPCWDWWKWTWPPDVAESLWWYGDVNDLLRGQNHQPLNSETLTGTNSYRWQIVEFCDIYWLACFVGLTHPFPKDQRTLWRSSFRYFLVLLF